MFNNAAHFTTRDVTQINAKSYHSSSPGLVEFRDGSRFSNKTEIHTGEYHHHEGSRSEPVKDLYTHVAVGCIYDSAERFDAPNCHEETRKAVQEDIFSWMSAGPPDEVLWLTGPAGSGESAIMGTVSDKLKREGKLAATFFFSAYTGTVETTTKRGFVTTLAYQLQRHPDFNERISVAMLATVRDDPAVFGMSLQQQMEALVLLPLRKSQDRTHSASIPTHAILIDGVDECGEGQYNRPGRSRQGDQIEVLSVLQQASKDTAFPFRIIIASRPETWIRSFFADVAAGKTKEIFLDDKYSPNDDIRLFLKSKLAELCRRYGLDASAWPTEQNIDQLVRDASGQFIYAATVLRFIDTPPSSPQDQLRIVLMIKVEDRSNPFCVLDALYTSILLSSPSPGETVIWLKALQVLNPTSIDALSKLTGLRRLQISAWTVDRLFESSSGQARMLLGLPSLVYILDRAGGHDCDSREHGLQLRARGDIPIGWNARYTCYHKSFIDYLGDAGRCGSAFPDVNDGRVEMWIGERCAQTLRFGGPQVPIEPGLLLTFQRCFLDILMRRIRGTAQLQGWKPWSRHSSAAVGFDDALLSNCQPNVWLDASRKIASSSSSYAEPHPFAEVMAKLAHKNCRPLLPCKPGCKLWKDAVADAKRDQPPPGPSE